MAESLIQPQGFARLNPASRIAMAAHAIVLGSADVNVATGRLLDVSGPVARTPAKPGIPFNFRKNGWRATEVGPVIGTQSFVEFWLGYPGEAGVSGAGPGNNPPPAYVTGSSSNQIGIFTNRGTGYGDGGNPDSWGMLAKWSDIQNNAQEVLVAGQLAMLIVVRRQTGMEFWHDGVLVRTLAQTPYSLPAQSLICGAFITADFWRTSGDTLLAGRAVIEPTETEIKALSANPWMLFDDPHGEDADLAGPAYTLAAGCGDFAVGAQPAGMATRRRFAAAPGALTLVGSAGSVIASRRLPAGNGVLQLATASAALSARRRLSAAVGGISFSAGAAGLAVARKLSLQSAALSFVGGAVSFVYASAPGSAGPTYTLVGGTGAVLASTAAARMLAAHRLSAAGGAVAASVSQARLIATRRLAANVGEFSVSTSAARLTVARRINASAMVLTVSPAGAGLRASRLLRGGAGNFANNGGAVTFKYAGKAGIVIDAVRVPASRTVVFGGGSRVVVFGGGTRVVVFDVPSIEKDSSVANAAKPYFKDGKWFVDKDPDEKSYYVADVTQELIDRATSIKSVEPIVVGVRLTEGPSIQGTVIVVKLEDMDIADGAANFWTARVTCANGERFDRTTWFNRVDN